MIKKQKKLGEFFIAELGKLVKQTERTGIEMGLTIEQSREIIRTTLEILSEEIKG